MGIDPTSGEAFDLRSEEDVRRALKAMDHGDVDELRGIDLSEVERLQNLSRRERRAELRTKPKVERQELERLLKEARERGR